MQRRRISGKDCKERDGSMYKEPDDERNVDTNPLSGMLLFVQDEEYLNDNSPQFRDDVKYEVLGGVG